MRNKEHQREYIREYRQRPDVRERRIQQQKTRCQSQKYKDSRKKWAHEYNQRPDVKTRKRMLKMSLIEYKGGKCARCGVLAESENSCIFEFHHRDPVEKEYTLGHQSLTLKNVKTELDKCIMLCANCHRIIHYEIYRDDAIRRARIKLNGGK